jgi:hypothetical protein
MKVHCQLDSTNGAGHLAISKGRWTHVRPQLPCRPWAPASSRSRSRRSEARRSRQTTGPERWPLSSVEAGRDSASWDVIALYEDRFDADGQLWTAYVEAQTSPRPPQRAVGDAPSYPIPGDESTFIADITVPDGTVMPPKFIFEKVWRIKNTGSVPWVGRRLARDGAAGGYGVPHSPAYVPIPDTMPGEEVDIACRCARSRSRAPRRRGGRWWTRTAGGSSRASTRSASS